MTGLMKIYYLKYW